MTRKSPEAKARSLEKRRQRRRSDAEFKEKEQNENTVRHREHREDQHFRDEEQFHDTIRRSTRPVAMVLKMRKFFVKDCLPTFATTKAKRQYFPKD